MVGSGGAGSTGTYGRNATAVSQAAERMMSPSSCHGGKGQERVTALGRCRADIAGGHSGTYGFCRLVPCQLQANAVASVPFLLLHVLEIPQVTVCPGVSGEGEGSRKTQSWPPQPCPPGAPKASTHGPSLGRCWEMGTAGKCRWVCVDLPWPAPSSLRGLGARTRGDSAHCKRMQLLPSFPGAPQELPLSAGTPGIHAVGPPGVTPGWPHIPNSSKRDSTKLVPLLRDAVLTYM